MKPIIRQSNKNGAFTIIELLTVMSIIVILIGLLVPALNRVRIYAKEVRQRAQFHSMDAALELFNNEFDGYPPSGALDPLGASYCGAMKLCEAMMGQDMLGFHTNSVYRANGTDTYNNQLYHLSVTDPLYGDNLKARKGPFLPLESANAYMMGDIYPTADVQQAQMDPCSFVLCDVYTREMQSGQKTGMPVLYYKANTANNGHYDPDNPGNPPPPSNPYDDAGNIYNYYDNYFLLELGKPWMDSGTHSLTQYEKFYKNIRNHKIRTAVRPYRTDSYILLSAGYDNEYGTADDVFNFDWKYIP